MLLAVQVDWDGWTAGGWAAAANRVQTCILEQKGEEPGGLRMVGAMWVGGWGVEAAGGCCGAMTRQLAAQSNCWQWYCFAFTYE